VLRGRGQSVRTRTAAASARTSVSTSRSASVIDTGRAMSRSAEDPRRVVSVGGARGGEGGGGRWGGGGWVGARRVSESAGGEERDLLPSQRPPQRLFDWSTSTGGRPRRPGDVPPVRTTSGCTRPPRAADQLSRARVVWQRTRTTRGRRRFSVARVQMPTFARGQGCRWLSAQCVELALPLEQRGGGQEFFLFLSFFYWRGSTDGIPGAHSRGRPSSPSAEAHSRQAVAEVGRMPPPICAGPQRQHRRPRPTDPFRPIPHSRTLRPPSSPILTNCQLYRSCHVQRGGPSQRSGPVPRVTLRRAIACRPCPRGPALALSVGGA